MLNKLLTRLLKKRKRSPPGLILQATYRLSDMAVGLASQLQCTSAERYTKNNPTWNPLSREVLTRTHEQEVTYHKAVLCLAELGWAHTTQPLMKPMIEGLVNALVVGEGGSEFRAFKKLVFDGLRADVDEPTRLALLKHIREIIMPHLSQKDRGRAEKYVQQKKHGLYWYSEEYSGPREVIRRLAPKLMVHFDVAGGASHGAQVGYKFFDADWGSENISPRKDPYSANLAAVVSIRLLTEFNGLRSQFEGLGANEEYRKCLKELNGMRPLIEEAKQHRPLFEKFYMTE